MKAKTDYQTEFNVLSTSGAGVILTRAREPFRVIEALKETAIQRALGNPAKPFGFKHWSVRTGWATPDLTDASAAEVMDGTAAPQAALNKITDLAGGGKAAFPDGVYILSGMHPWLSQEKPDPILVETLRKYAYDFATDNRRVVLVMPESFVLPSELQHDIPVLDYELPDSGELRAVLGEVLASAFPEGEVPEVFTEAEIAQTVASATGMTRLEAELAFSQAVIRNQQALPNIPFDAFNRVVLETKTTVVKRSEVLELMPPGRVEDVGGLDQLKAWIARRKKCFTKAASDFGVVPPKGIALIGPPGTGKSVSAKAIAATLGQPLIRFDVSRVFGSLVGQTEGRVRSALKQLEAMAPCVAFIDEIDKAGIDPRNSGGDSGTSKRVMGSLLTFMQESTAPIFWLFTANRVESLPSELLRKGRLDEVFAVLPPNRIEREEVLRIHLTKGKQDPSTIEGLDTVASASAGYVSSELEAAIKEAIIEAFDTGEPVTGGSILRHLTNSKPLSVAFKPDFDAMMEWAKNNARLASTPEDKTGMEGKTFLPVGLTTAAPARRRRLR